MTDSAGDQYSFRYGKDPGAVIGAPSWGRHVDMATGILYAGDPPSGNLITLAQFTAMVQTPAFSDMLHTFMAYANK